MIREIHLLRKVYDPRRATLRNDKSFEQPHQVATLYGECSSRDMEAESSAVVGRDGPDVVGRDGPEAFVAPRLRCPSRARCRSDVRAQGALCPPGTTSAITESHVWLRPSGARPR